MGTRPRLLKIVEYRGVKKYSQSKKTNQTKKKGKEERKDGNIKPKRRELNKYEERIEKVRY